MSDKIYMPLLDEGVTIWRPVPAYRLDGQTYIVLRPAGYNESAEHWQFPPGSIVRVIEKTTHEGEILSASELVQVSRQTA